MAGEERNVSVLAIDPGNTESAFVVYDGERPVEFGKWSNDTLLRQIQVGHIGNTANMAIETLKPRGMPTSFEEMQTQLWAGRYWQAWWDRQGGEKFALSEPTQVFRIDVKRHLCGKVTANDSNIRAALIDLFGGQNKAIGGKKCHACKGNGWRGRNRDVCDYCKGGKWEHPPGPLKGIAEDVWSALAIAITWSETKRPPTGDNP
jgi:hypothetical protein